MSSNMSPGSFATKSLRSASRSLSASSTAQPDANTPTSIEFVPVDQSVSSFWKRSANGTVATSIVAPVIALNSSPRCSSRPAMTGPGRVRMLTVTPSCFISAFAVGMKAAVRAAVAPNVAAAKERLMVISWPPVFQCLRQGAGFRPGVRLPLRAWHASRRAARQG